MPPSRPAATAATATANANARLRSPANRARARPRRVLFVRSLAGIRWDRMGRISLLVTLVIVSAIGIQRVMSYLSARSQAAGALAEVHALKRANASLEARQRSLSEPATIAAAARRLGMVRIGEHPYAVTSNR